MTDPITDYEHAVQELKRAVDEIEAKQERHEGRELAAFVGRSSR